MIKHLKSNLMIPATYRGFWLRRLLGKMGSFLILMMITCLGFGIDGVTAAAHSHSYINTIRSASTSRMFFQQNVDGEYGQYTLLGERSSETGTASKDFSDRQTWKGYSIGSTIGLEAFKFVQFTMGHELTNISNTKESLESLSGSRLYGALGLVFLSPVANLELRGGTLGSRLDYRTQAENGAFYGSGLFYSLGMNYFFTNQFSVFSSAKKSKENLVRSSGSADVKNIKTSSTSLGLGFRFWL